MILSIREPEGARKHLIAQLIAKECVEATYGGKSK
jgi:hypothetical protein